MTLRTETNPVREYQKRARDKLRLDECLRTEAISYGRFLKTENERFRRANPINLYGPANGHFRANFFGYHFRMASTRKWGSIFGYLWQKMASGIE